MNPICEILNAIDKLSDEDRERLYYTLSTRLPTTIAPVAVATYCNYCKLYHSDYICYVQQDPFVELVIHEVPVTERRGGRAQDYVKAFRTLKDVLGLSFQKTKELMEGEMPRTLKNGQQSEMEKIAQMLNECVGVKIVIQGPWNE